MKKSQETWPEALEALCLSYIKNNIKFSQILKTGIFVQLPTEINWKWLQAKLILMQIWVVVTKIGMIDNCSQLILKYKQYKKIVVHSENSTATNSNTHFDCILCRMVLIKTADFLGCILILNISIVEWNESGQLWQQRLCEWCLCDPFKW